MTFNPSYFFVTLGLFVIEVCIAVFVDDRVIRPFVGDVLVVILIYCFLRAFFRIQTTVAIALVFGLACLVEALQYFKVLNLLGWQNNTLLRVVLGTTFDGKDILAYAIGAAIVLWWEHRSNRTVLHREE